ncbi:phosphopantetheine-binding protein [Chitinophaga defluvii]|uniref:Phosphopantetheine-binding protein n=1 Tax=Chitinophaga defluvii TaxID=3163343 RepID=A0ABV2T792_9BACT
MMDVAAIIQTTNDFLVAEFEANPAELTPDADMKATLELDSLDYIDLVVAVEAHFGFKVKPEDFQHIITFQHFYDYVAARARQLV